MPSGFVPENVCVPDTVDAIIPARAVFGDELRDGQLALWNPYISGGTTLGATPDAGVLSPVALPFLVLPAWLAPGYVKLLEFAVGIGFTFLFLRRLSLQRPSALLGGLLFVSSGFMVVWTNWPQTNVAAFIPALFWSIERFLQLRTLGAALPIAPTVAAMLLGGFPAITVLTLYMGAAYLLARLLQARLLSLVERAYLLLYAAASVALGIALTAAQLLPFALRLDSLELARDFTPDIHLPLLALVTLGIPNALGTCTDAAHYYYGPINEIEIQSAFGTVGLALIAFGFLLRSSPALQRAKIFFLAATLVVLLLAYVGETPLAIAQHLPTVATSFIGRIRSLLGFSLAVLAAIGFNAVLTQRQTRPRAMAITVAAMLTAGGGAAGYWLWSDIRKMASSAHGEQLPYIERQAAIAVFAAAIATIAITAALRWRKFRGLALVVVAGLATTQAAMFAIPFWAMIPKSHFYPTTGTHEYLERNLKHERFAAEEYTMYPGSNAFYELRSVHGHGFTSPRWGELLRAVDRDVFASPTFTMFNGEVSTATSPVLDRLGVRYFITSPDSPVYGKTVSQLPDDGLAQWAHDETVAAPLPSTSLRGVGVTFAKEFRTSDPYASVGVVLSREDGTVVAEAVRRIYAVVPAGDFVIPVALDESAPREPLFAQITLNARGATAEIMKHGDNAALTVVLPQPDGLRLVRAGEATIYERTASLPRIRWAGNAHVMTDTPTRLAYLSGPIQDPNSVVLSSPGPTGDGHEAEVSVLNDGTDRIEVRVRSEGWGYLVVADALTEGWTAKVDGARTRIRMADHALAAVLVPPGEHLVALEYRPAGAGAGIAATIASATAIAAIALSSKRKEVRRLATLVRARRNVLDMGSPRRHRE
jgi:hypothetical protein